MLWSRLGRYDVAELDRLLWEERALFEWRAFLYPMDDLPLLRARMRRFRAGADPVGRWAHEWVRVNASFRRYVLRELERRGPLVSRELEDRAIEPWRSTGWTGNRNVSQMLEFLWARGEIAVVARRGAQRVWDLAERWYPETETVPAAEAEAALAAKRLRSLGIAREGPGVRVTVRGVRGEWVVDPQLLETRNEPVPERATLLSPFDRLIHDRVRTRELFGFRYKLEIYVPQAEREYGYFVLPALRADRLVGRVDPELDRRAGVLRVNGIWTEPGDEEEPIRGAVEELAAWLGAREVVWPTP